MKNQQSISKRELEEPIAALNEKLDRATAAIEALEEQLRERNGQVQALSKLVAESATEQRSLRLLAARRQLEMRSLTVQLHRQRERVRQLQLRLRDEQRAHQMLSEEKEHAVRDARELRHWLGEVYASRIWKLASFYYRLVTETPLAYPYDFVKVWRRHGLRYSLHTIGNRLTNLPAAPPGHGISGKPARHALETLIEHLNGQKYRGVFIIASTFVFDQSLNQRAIKLSTSLAARGFGIIYVAWRWSRHEQNIPVGEEVARSIFQIPVDVFLEHHDCFRSLQQEFKTFIVQFPYPGFLRAGVMLKGRGFGTVYEIVDNWEEFQKVNQAPWYARDAEDAMVINFDLITAVSEPLRNKFASLRADIELVPNGYDPGVLGMENRNIARPLSHNTEISIGYFGHLTESWFDWNLIFDILDLAGKEHVRIRFHIIGFGEPRQVRNRIKARQSTIEIHGRVPTSELYQHAANWNIGIIPFKKGSLGESVDPIKVYEYIYFGLPVLASGIPHLSNMPSVYCFDGAPDFMQSLRSIQSQQLPEDARHVAALLQRSTWNERFSHLIRLIETNPAWKCL